MYVMSFPRANIERWGKGRGENIAIFLTLISTSHVEQLFSSLPQTNYSMIVASKLPPISTALPPAAELSPNQSSAVSSRHTKETSLTIPPVKASNQPPISTALQQAAEPSPNRSAVVCSRHTKEISLVIPPVKACTQPPISTALPPAAEPSLNRSSVVSSQHTKANQSPNSAASTQVEQIGLDDSGISLEGNINRK